MKKINFSFIDADGDTQTDEITELEIYQAAYYYYLEVWAQRDEHAKKLRMQGTPNEYADARARQAWERLQALETTRAEFETVNA